jgi:hypothetical protein
MSNDFWNPRNVVMRKYSFRGCLEFDLNLVNRSSASFPDVSLVFRFARRLIFRLGELIEFEWLHYKSLSPTLGELNWLLLWDVKKSTPPYDMLIKL